MPNQNTNTKNKAKRLMTIIETANFPNCFDLYQQADYQVTIVNSVRKALALLKKQSVDLIIAEFIYSPQYGTRISNIDSLFAQLQSKHPQTRLILFADKDYQHHLKQFQPQYQITAILTYPIPPHQLQALL